MQQDNNRASLIPPEIVKAAHLSGTVKQYLNLFLHGDLTYELTLEKMVVSLTKENRSIKTILSRHLKETPQVILGLPESDKKKLKLLPKSPL